MKIVENLSKEMDLQRLDITLMDGILKQLVEQNMEQQLRLKQEQQCMLIGSQIQQQ